MWWYSHTVEVWLQKTNCTTQVARFAPKSIVKTWLRRYLLAAVGVNGYNHGILTPRSLFLTAELYNHLVHWNCIPSRSKPWLNGWGFTGLNIGIWISGAPNRMRRQLQSAGSRKHLGFWAGWEGQPPTGHWTGCICIYIYTWWLIPLSKWVSSPQL